MAKREPLPKPANGSRVMQRNYRAYKAAFRLCEHDHDEVTCAVCIKNHKYEMGLEERVQPEASTGPKLTYVDWGRSPCVQDLWDVDGKRISNQIRERKSLELDLSDVVIDFGAPGSSIVKIFRGASGKQFWVRLPYSDPNLIDWPLLEEQFLKAYEHVVRGRQSLWKRTIVLTDWEVQTEGE